ncbi:MAG TPA: hypothetical protein VM009_03525 [Terriglobales bacterium]|nr:hypothetical protein [Terriglobales bacterium]
MKHLTEEQFVEWANGERKDECAQHLRECPQCLDEVRELSMALEGFKAQIHDGAKERHVPFTGAQIRARANSQPVASRSFWKIIPVPALAAAAVLAIMLYKPAPAPQVNQVASSDEADNALLLAINSDVYRAAPSALRPAGTLNMERNQILTGSQRKK